MQKHVVLIYPYFRAATTTDKLFQPLGISYLGSQLKARDIDVTLVDCTFEDFQAVVDRITALRPAIVAVSVMISISRSGFALASALRERLPKTLFIAGGPLPTLYPERFIPDFDLVFRGEGDEIFPQFCAEMLDAHDAESFLQALDPNRYPGIYFTRHGSVVGSDPTHNPTEVLEKLPPPERSGIRHDLYQAFWRKTEGCMPTTLMVTRGCPFFCDFCSKPVWGSVFRKPAVDHIFREIVEIQALGYDQLWIADDSFTLDLEYLRHFCMEKVARGIDIPWTCLSRTTGLDQEIVRLMKRAGCVKVYLGLESGSDRVLGLMAKRTTVRDGIDAVRLFEREGIRTAGFFIVGYPGETKETVEATFAHALSLSLDEVFFNIPFPLPGSALFDRVVDLDNRADWDKAGEIKFVYTSEFDEEWLRQGIVRTMKDFTENKRRRADCYTHG